MNLNIHDNPSEHAKKLARASRSGLSIPLETALDAADALLGLVGQCEMLEHEIKAWSGGALSVRNACEKAGVLTTFQPSGIPRDLADPVRDIIHERDEARRLLEEHTGAVSDFLVEFALALGLPCDTKPSEMLPALRSLTAACKAQEPKPEGEAP